MTESWISICGSLHFHVQHHCLRYFEVDSMAQIAILAPIIIYSFHLTVH